MRVPKLCWAMLLIGVACLAASVLVAGPMGGGAESQVARFLWMMWLWCTLAGLGVAAGNAAAYFAARRRLDRLSDLLADMIAEDNSVDRAKALMDKEGYLFSEEQLDGDVTRWTWTKDNVRLRISASIHRFQPGDRVTAFVCSDAKSRTLSVLGDGVFAGRHPLPPEWSPAEGMEGLRIDLDCGVSVWGPQCWWGSCAHVARKFPKPEWTWVQVDPAGFAKDWASGAGKAVSCGPATPE